MEAQFVGSPADQVLRKFDHDGNGRKGGSKKGKASTRAKAKTKKAK